MNERETPPTGNSARDLATHEFLVPTHSGAEIYGVKRSARSPGPAVLLLHGLGIGWQYWDLPASGYSTMAFLADEGFDVYAIDHRGYGRSSVVSGWNVRACEVARDIGDVMDFIMEGGQVERVGLVGHSWGGMVAIMAAAQYQSSVSCLVVVGMPYRELHPSFRNEVAQIRSIPAPEDGWLPNQTHVAMEQFLFSYDSDVLEVYKSIVESDYPRIPLGIIADVEELPHADHARALPCPTLAICGTLEDVVVRKDALRLLDDLPMAEKDLLLVGNAGHLTGLEALSHRRVDRAVGDWLREYGR
jgi:pimeloyl-ACP methyl ester carboxylesterase